MRVTRVMIFSDSIVEMMLNKVQLPPTICKFLSIQHDISMLPSLSRKDDVVIDKY